MVNAGSGPGEPACRSPALERRLRRRRQEARIRARLATDAVLLTAHHASAPPGASAPDLQAQVHSLASEVARLRHIVELLMVLAEPPSCVRGRRTTQCDAPIGAVCKGGKPGPASEKDRREAPPSRSGEGCERAQALVPQPSANTVTGDGMLQFFKPTWTTRGTKQSAQLPKFNYYLRRHQIWKMSLLRGT